MGYYQIFSQGEKAEVEDLPDLEVEEEERKERE
jgi:hypothetical protein